MELVNFFSNQLQSTSGALAYSITLNPEDNLVSPIIDELSKILYPNYTAGHKYMGIWSRHRLLHHLITYEQNSVLPVIEYWKSDAPIPELEKYLSNLKNEEANYDDTIPIQSMIENLRSLRQSQIAFIRKMSNEDLKQTKHTPFWETQTLEWILGKSIQHSFEHGNKMLRHALFLKEVRKFFIGAVKERLEDGDEFDLKYLETLESRAKEHTM